VILDVGQKNMSDPETNSSNNPHRAMMNALERLNDAFLNRDPSSFEDKEMEEYIQTLCSESVSNEEVRSRSIIRALTINHIQMGRVIHELKRENDRTQWFVIFLAVVTLIVVGIQTWFTIFPHSTNDTPVSQQVQHTQRLLSEGVAEETSRKD
jgi:hypothetical protein